MIEAKNLTKRFESLMAVDHINAQILDGSVFGLIGTNGAGKSTFLRMLSGVLKPDEGSVTIDGKEVYENVEVKSRFFYISDDQYFFSNSTPEQLMKFYMGVYPKFNKNRFIHLMDSFELDRKRKINTFSKGMKKQVSVICGVCAGTDYLFCDETFDGLDPVMRRQIWSILMAEVQDNGMTVLVSSHNLRELEDVCDHVGIMNQGKVIIERSLSELQGNICKIQVACQSGMPKLPDPFEVLHMSNIGRVYTMIVRGNPKEAAEAIRTEGDNLAIVDILPLTLEEIFVYEMGGLDYEVKDILF